MSWRPYSVDPDAPIGLGRKHAQSDAQAAKHVFTAAFLPAILCLTLCAGSRAEQLPIKTYTTADGLPRNGINRIVRDSHGFLWFCTVEGLSRFDGYTFTNYGVEQGIPDQDVRDLIETQDGEYWIATHNGVARFEPGLHSPKSAQTPNKGGKAAEPKRRFVAYPTNWNQESRHVMRLLEDRDGTLWCGTSAGLGRLERSGGAWQFQPINLDVPVTPNTNSISALLQDRGGALWIGTWGGLYRRWPDGRVERYGSGNGLPKTGPIHAILEDRNGRLWIGTSQGLYLLVAKPDPKQSVVAHVFTTRQGLPHDRTEALLESSDGNIWVGTASGLSKLFPAGGGEIRILRGYRTIRADIAALTTDREGNLWIGTKYGAMRLARNGFTTYGAEDGFGDAGINSIFEDDDGRLCVINKVGNRLVLHWFDGTHFLSLPFNLPRKIIYLGWGWNQIGFQDHRKEWWLATGQGLFRYPEVSRVEQLTHTVPKVVYTSKNGLSGDDVFRTYEDSRGEVWASGAGGTFRMDPASQTFHVSVPTLARSDGWGVTTFAEDRLGNVWMGFYWHDLARYQNGRFTVFTPADGLPDGSIFSLHVDHLGRLWIATTRGGLARVDDPGADRPRFVTFPGVEGLSNTDVDCITEDQWGRIYVGTGHGLYRLDPERSRTKRYTIADGLAGDPIVAFRDRNGMLWFGSDQGLSRLVPGLERSESRAPPPIRIIAVRVTGLPYQLSELGESRLDGLVLEPTQNAVQVDFASLNFGVGEVLRYQFLLEGADKDWSVPTEQRSVSFARLAPGTYRLMVRALNSEGLVSAEPAIVSFRVLPPVWQRGWFLSISGLLLALGFYLLYRYRVARVVELERVRTRIATDLHDDIGTSLSGMAFLSEAVKQQVGSSRPEVFEMASEVAAMARGLARALGDVVWSIDPQRDDLQSLITHVRSFASAVLEAQGITWSLLAPPEPKKVRLTPKQRHHLWLIFKEGLNNIARHAACASAAVAVTVSDHQLRAEIVDDGCGFNQTPSLTERQLEGNGLNNMRLRATQLAGQLRIHSVPGRGTRLELTVPLK